MSVLGVESAGRGSAIVCASQRPPCSAVGGLAQHRHRASRAAPDAAARRSATGRGGCSSRSFTCSRSSKAAAARCGSSCCRSRPARWPSQRSASSAATAGMRPGYLPMGRRVGTVVGWRAGGLQPSAKLVASCWHLALAASRWEQQGARASRPPRGACVRCACNSSWLAPGAAAAAGCWQAWRLPPQPAHLMGLEGSLAA
jgi:hypothetical protein